MSDQIADCVVTPVLNLTDVTQASKDADSMPDENNNCDVVVDSYDSILDENARRDLVSELMLILTFKCSVEFSSLRFHDIGTFD